MQHIYGVLELGYIEDAIFTLRMDSNLNNSSADEWNRPPIGGQTSRLNQAQLVADFATRCLGEPSQAVTTVAEPFDRFCAIPHSLRLYRSFIIRMERDLLVYPVPKSRSATTGGPKQGSARLFRGNLDGTARAALGQAENGSRGEACDSQAHSSQERGMVTGCILGTTRESKLEIPGVPIGNRGKNGNL